MNCLQDTDSHPNLKLKNPIRQKHREMHFPPFCNSEENSKIFQEINTDIYDKGNQNI